MSFDPEKYQGKYYQVYKQNAWFETDCEASTANYTYKDGILYVLNTCYNRHGTGHIYTPQEPYLREARNIRGTATPVEGENGVLHLRFLPGQEGIYRVFFTDYNYALVGDLKTNYLSILSRHPYPSDKTINTLKEIARKYGFRILH